MKNWLLFALAFAVSLAATASLTSRVNAQNASSIYRKLEHNRQSLKSLRASISMEKYNVQLRENETYQGVVRYMPAGRNAASAFVWLEWKSPKHEILSVVNGKYILYEPRLNIAYVGNTRSMHNNEDNDVLKLINMSGAQLQSQFEPLQDIRNETLWGGVETTHFTAVPKGAASYKYIEGWIDQEGMPVQTKMVEKNGDATTIRLTNLERNASMSTEDFIQKLDASVKRVKS